MPAPPWGVVATGFHRPTLTDLRAELEADFRAEFGGNINLDPDGNFGRLAGILARREHALWELGEAAYNAAYPDTAAGASLDNVGALRSIERLAEDRTRVWCRLDGVPASPDVPQGHQVRHVTTRDLFRTTAPVVWDSALQLLLAEVEVVTAGVGTYTVTVNGIARTFTAGGADTPATIAAGLVAAINTPAITNVSATTAGLAAGRFRVLVTAPAATTDLSAIAVLVSLSSSIGPLPMAFRLLGRAHRLEAVAVGPALSEPGTITVIETPSAGWQAITNPIGGDVGRNTETDAEYRIRQASSLRIAGAGPVDAIRARLLRLTGVDSATIRENTGDVVDAGGRPPHSFEAIVVGGTDAAVAQLIWDTKPAGIATFGNVNGGAGVSVRDAAGATQTVRFSRPVDRLIWIRVTQTALHPEESLPTGAASIVQSAVATFGSANHAPGVDVVPQRFFGAVFSAVRGLLSITVEQALDAGGAPGAYSTAARAIADTEVARFAATRVQTVGI